MSDEWKQFIADDIAREESLPNYWEAVIQKYKCPICGWIGTEEEGRAWIEAHLTKHAPDAGDSSE